MSNIATLLKKALADNQINASDVQQSQWVTYLEQLVVWNKVFNLTSITDPKEMVYLHIIDSLLVAPFIHGTHCLDVGSGAGLPGIPLAILHPEQHWTLLDKNSKKTRFMIQVAGMLGLKNVAVVHVRAEDFHPTTPFDSILSRAYASLRLFIETTQHALSPSGKLIAMKGKSPDDEMVNLPTEWQAQKPVRLSMKGMDVDRHIVCLEITNP
ncbi:MAG TPA: 16S rRNA (guanine(527)-N(7))-methyltransferase RsmG [Gammaproteobacteria bacterium]|nr:16S rRNA (guanine(527)-N(7))-methyltransferase RsmG [Gammaproteobacteria bacterium]